MMHNGSNSSNAMRILYYGAGWPTNIGNAFIDLGAMALLRQAIPDAQIAFASEMPRWFFANTSRRPMELTRNGLTSAPIEDNALDIASITQCDLVVFSGMAMCDEFIKINGLAIVSIARRGIPVLLLGTGALTYSESEKSLFGEFLRQVRPIGFVSRDDNSFEAFAGLFPAAHKGIDCGFYVPDAYTPFPLVLDPYIVANFDSMPEPTINLGKHQLIYAHHGCWGPIKPRNTRMKNTLISDIPNDYLTLYANAQEVHSDRVHACVATLAYGRPARFYHSTPRGSLFDAMGAVGIRKQLVSADMAALKKHKQAQVEFVRELVSAQVLSH